MKGKNYKNTSAITPHLPDLINCYYFPFSVRIEISSIQKEIYIGDIKNKVFTRKFANPGKLSFSPTP